MVKIGIASASTKIKLSAIPKYAIGSVTADSNGHSFTPSAVSPALIDPLDSTFIPQTTASNISSVPIGGIVFQQGVNINIGAPTNTLVPQLLNAYLYKFDDFGLSNQEDFEEGDLVYFKSESTGRYRSSLQKININVANEGAYHQIFYFKEYNASSSTNGTLKVFAKGYIDVPYGKIDGWQSGRTLYVGNQNKISTVPSTASGSWVRSLGFCIPYNVTGISQSKNLIWFDPDTTHVKLRI